MPPALRLEQAALRWPLKIRVFEKDQVIGRAEGIGSKATSRGRARFAWVYGALCVWMAFKKMFCGCNPGYFLCNISALQSEKTPEIDHIKGDHQRLMPPFFESQSDSLNARMDAS